VMVMTPAILVDRLLKEDITMQRLSLLLFDEAHHCRKNHPYSQVMEYYHHSLDKGDQVPHIFGMTACPVDVAVRLHIPSTAWAEMHRKCVCAPP
jgi:endoribonuclease Dicer